MSEDKHTPGPWAARQAFDKEGFEQDHLWIEGRTVSTDIAETVGEYSVTTERANAHLIAAAPDMLAALRQAEDTLCDRGNDMPHPASRRYEVLIQVREAITKAEGKGGTND